MNKAEILEEAKRLVTQDRNETHGDAKVQLTQVAALWSTFAGFDFSAADVAMMNVLQKISRTAHGKLNTDDFVDICGYAAIAGELASLEAGQN